MSTSRYRPRSPEYNRNVNLWTKYRMTLTEYDEIREEQDYRCAICGRHEDEIVMTRGRPRADGTKTPAAKLSIDHDHRCCKNSSESCGRCHRGLLCQECNAAIGLLREDPDLFRRATDYLEKWRDMPLRTVAPTRENPQLPRRA